MSFNIAQKSQLDARELLLLEQEVKDRGKNMIIAYVLWYFLGVFGGHRFYLGRTGSAIAQLILTISVIGVIVTSIWWIVDAFLLHQWVRDRNRAVEGQLIDEILAHKHFHSGSF
ncbi:TM2 domain-containing protein [Paenibacillus sp. MMO-177]|uniref:TM2 domain-containing protein n=1 Tax=Paenibacillus sp. MMO-177 TaxID=3081289 RepID=UPI003019288F